jgi:hypothetical protein
VGKSKKPQSSEPKPLFNKTLNLGLLGRVEAALTDDFVVIVFFYEGNPIPQAPVLVPRAWFADEQQASEWAEKTVKTFEDYWSKVMEFETNRHFTNVGNFILRKMGILGAPSIEELIQDQVKTQESILRGRFNLPVGRGNFSKWTEYDLRVAIEKILTNKPAWTWVDINEELRRLHADKAPASGEALRQLARRFGLKLRAIKREAAKRRVKV